MDCWRVATRQRYWRAHLKRLRENEVLQTVRKVGANLKRGVGLHQDGRVYTDALWDRRIRPQPISQMEAGNEERVCVVDQVGVCAAGRHPAPPPLHSIVLLSPTRLAHSGANLHRHSRSPCSRCGTDPSLPAVLLDGPALLLHLQPSPRRPRLVQTRFLLGDQALVVVRDHLGPRVKPFFASRAPAIRTRCRRRRSPDRRADRAADAQ